MVNVYFIIPLKYSLHASAVKAMISDYFGSEIVKHSGTLNPVYKIQVSEEK